MTYGNITRDLLNKNYSACDTRIGVALITVFKLLRKILRLSFSNFPVFRTREFKRSLSEISNAQNKLLVIWLSALSTNSQQLELLASAVNWSCFYWGAEKKVWSTNKPATARLRPSLSLLSFQNRKEIYESDGWAILKAHKRSTE